MRKINFTWLLLVASTFIFTNSMEDMGHDMHDHGMHHHSKHSAKMHGPIGLMGDHFHRKGESMVSIRYMKMTMDQNYIGSCLLYTSPSPRDMRRSRMPSSA